MTGKFSFKSDVWSYGVTLFEIWSKGKVPYGNIDNMQVIKNINGGKNPNNFYMPNYPPKINELQNLIFQLDPKNRPSFGEIKVKLSSSGNESQGSSGVTVTSALANLLGRLNLGNEPKKPNLNPKHLELVQRLKESNRVKSKLVEMAMSEVDRGHYVKQNPYLDKPQSIGCGVNISAPHMHAVMLEAIADSLKPGSKCLDIGSGSGYITACMAIMAGSSGRVVGIDHMEELVRQSIINIKSDNPELLSSGRVKIVVGDGRDGYAADGPYDIIHIGAAASKIYNALAIQLKEGGRIIVPVGPKGGNQKLQIIDKVNGQLVTNSVMGVIFASLTSKEEQLSIS